jgi:hypothetical protein
VRFAVEEDPLPIQVTIAPIIIRANLNQFLLIQDDFTADDIEFMSTGRNKASYARVPMNPLACGRLDPHLWMTQGKVVIPPSCMSLKARLISTAHLTGLHAQHKEMTSNLSHVFWPSLSKDIHDYVNSCPSCQVVDAPPRSGQLGFHNIDNPDAPDFTHILDHLEISPPSNRGHVGALTVTDPFTRYVWIIPVTSHSAADTLDAAMRVWHETGLPYVIQHDNSLSFSEDFADFCAMFNVADVRQKYTDSYAPWQNGKGERQHGPIVNKLRKMVLGKDQRDWDLHIHQIAGVINSSYNRNTNSTAFYLRFGRHKRSPTIATTDISSPTGTIAEWHKAIAFIQDVLRQKNDLVSLMESHVEYRTSGPLPSFTEGQKVCLFFPTRMGESKLGSLWRPGYIITKVISGDPTHYHVARQEPDGKLYDEERVPTARLRPWRDSTTNPVDPSALRITDDLLLVQSILSHALTKDEHGLPFYTFTVKWADPSKPPCSADLQDLLRGSMHLMLPYCKEKQIPLSHLKDQRARVNKLRKAQDAKALLDKIVPLRIAVSAIFGTKPFHPTAPTYSWNPGKGE